MFYTIYKTTNLINGKFYIGKHKTKELNDGYLGSGKLLRRAIKKYGIENFHKEILHICKDEEHMNLLEKILVVPDKELNYNLCPGGRGGWTYINTTCHNNKGNKRRVGNYGWKVRPDTSCPLYRQKISESIKALYENGFRNPFLNKTHTQETKDKIGQINSIKQAGELNSQYGTCWITNGTESKKIKKEVDSIPEGWYKGRVIKKVTSKTETPDVYDSLKQNI